MNDLRFCFFLSSGVTTAAGGLWDVHGGGSLVIFWFGIFPPFGITHDFEASLLGVFLHFVMSTVDVLLSSLSCCDGRRPTVSEQLHPCPCPDGLFLAVKLISTSPNDVFPSLLVVGFRIWSWIASLRTTT